jgi:hypothetical protein
MKSALAYEVRDLYFVSFYISLLHFRIFFFHEYDRKMIKYTYFLHHFVN